jgi:hypothetical protein
LPVIVLFRGFLPDMLLNLGCYNNFLNYCSFLHLLIYYICQKIDKVIFYCCQCTLAGCFFLTVLRHLLSLSQWVIKIVHVYIVISDLHISIIFDTCGCSYLFKILTYRQTDLHLLSTTQISVYATKTFFLIFY